MVVDPLQQGILSEEIDEELRSALQLGLLSSTDARYNLSPYFAYYIEQCIQALVERGQYCSARVHQDVVDIVVRIRAGEPFAHILHAQQQKHADKIADESMSIRTIELAARVASMHEIGKWKFIASGQGRLNWNHGTLGDCLTTFHAQSGKCDASGKLDSIFDIVAIEKLADITVIWTNNLADHLRLSDNGRNGTMELSIFHHATYLRMIMEDDQQTIFSPEFLAETLTTLALLFPHKDKVVQQWFKKKQAAEEQPLDWEVLSCGRLLPAHRRLERFSIWRERLSDLKQTFDEAEPGTMSQWWADRRKRAQWSTFWVAVLVLALTIFFGIVQSIEGALQVYKAFRPDGESVSQ